MNICLLTTLVNSILIPIIYSLWLYYKFRSLSQSSSGKNILPCSLILSLYIWSCFDYTVLMCNHASRDLKHIWILDSSNETYFLVNQPSIENYEHWSKYFFKHLVATERQTKTEKQMKQQQQTKSKSTL